MRRLILVVIVFVIVGCMNSEVAATGRSKSIPALNIWMASLDSNQVAHILVQNPKYYDPTRSSEVKRYRGGAYWVTPPFDGPFQVYKETDAALTRLEESCVVRDTVIYNGGIASYLRQRKFTWSATNGSDTVLYTSYPNYCAANMSRDSLVAHGNIDSTLYIIDTSFAIDAKGLRYIQSVDYYYASQGRREIRGLGSVYSLEAGGLFVGSEPFLGVYKVYY